MIPEDQLEPSEPQPRHKPVTRVGAGATALVLAMAQLIGYGELRGQVKAIDDVSGPKAVIQRLDRLHSELQDLSNQLAELRGELKQKKRTR